MNIEGLKSFETLNGLLFWSELYKLKIGFKCTFAAKTNSVWFEIIISYSEPFTEFNYSPVEWAGAGWLSGFS